MPEKRLSPRRRRAIRLSRSSCLTDRDGYPLSRSSRIVAGFAMRAPFAVRHYAAGAGRCQSEDDLTRVEGDLTRGGPPVRMLAMAMGPGAERWGRLPLIVLLVLPMFAAIGLCADDGWTAVADPAESDETRLRLAAGVLSDAAWLLPVPFSVWRTVRSDPRAPVVSGWTCLTPADRAPPRV